MRRFTAILAVCLTTMVLLGARCGLPGADKADRADRAKKADTTDGGSPLDARIAEIERRTALLQDTRTLLLQGWDLCDNNAAVRRARFFIRTPTSGLLEARLTVLAEPGFTYQRTNLQPSEAALAHTTGGVRVASLDVGLGAVTLFTLDGISNDLVTASAAPSDILGRITAAGVLDALGAQNLATNAHTHNTSVDRDWIQQHDHQLTLAFVDPATQGNEEDDEIERDTDEFVTTATLYVDGVDVSGSITYTNRNPTADLQTILDDQVITTFLASAGVHRIEIASTTAGGIRFIMTARTGTAP